MAAVSMSKQEFNRLDVLLRVQPASRGRCLCVDGSSTATDIPAVARSQAEWPIKPDFEAPWLARQSPASRRPGAPGFYAPVTGGVWHRR
jgi:hypothetical protein